MKKTLFIFSLIFLGSTTTAQSVGINTTGTAPDSSAMLDVKSNNKGFLLPRVFLTSITDSITIRKPVISLLVFNAIQTYPVVQVFMYGTEKAGTSSLALLIHL